MPSTRITHNPGTHVDHNEAGRQKCELYHSVKSYNKGRRKYYLWAMGDGRMALIFPGQGRAGQEGFMKEAHKMVKFEG